MASQRLLHILFLVSVFSCFLSSSDANKFSVGGRGGWVLNPSENYNHWAERNRFQVDDTLYFKYKKGSDSVLVVNKNDYYNCETKNPISKLEDGDSEFKLDRSGPFFFISGKDGNCQKGQKLIVVVLAQRLKNPPSGPVAAPPKALGPISPVPTSPPRTASPVPAPSALTPSATSPVPAPSTTLTPSPTSTAPAPSTTLTPSPTSPAPAPSTLTPSTPSSATSPAPAPSTLTPSLSPSATPPAPAPTSQGSSPATSPSSAPSGTTVSPAQPTPTPTGPTSSSSPPSSQNQESPTKSIAFTVTRSSLMVSSFTVVLVTMVLLGFRSEFSKI